MKKTRVRIAELDQPQLEQVKRLEEALGAWVVAMEPRVRLAHLSDEKLEQLKALEKELDLVLLAYEPA